jgi:hypothetical protein
MTLHQFTQPIREKIGTELTDFGGHLECMECHHVAPLSNVQMALAVGWPKCCGYTMRWWTARQIASGENLP